MIPYTEGNHELRLHHVIVWGILRYTFSVGPPWTELRCAFVICLWVGVCVCAHTPATENCTVDPMTQERMLTRRMEYVKGRMWESKLETAVRCRRLCAAGQTGEGGTRPHLPLGNWNDAHLAVLIRLYSDGWSQGCLAKSRTHPQSPWPARLNPPRHLKTPGSGCKSACAYWRMKYFSPVSNTAGFGCTPPLRVCVYASEWGWMYFI